MSNKHRKLGSKPKKLTDFDRQQLEMIRAMKKYAEENNLKYIAGFDSEEEFLENRLDVMEILNNSEYVKEKRKKELEALNNKS